VCQQSTSSPRVKPQQKRKAGVRESDSSRSQESQSPEVGDESMRPRKKKGSANQTVEINSVCAPRISGDPLSS